MAPAPPPSAASLPSVKMAALPVCAGKGGEEGEETGGEKMAETGKGRAATATAATPGGKGLTAEQIVSRFNRLRQEQRGLASKAAELELELNEHGLVIETLREVDPSRKCFRMVGGILVERTVREVLPALEGNKEQISRILESLSQQLRAKGRELNEFREQHNIRLGGDEDPRQPPREGPEEPKGGSAGVLVS